MSPTSLQVQFCDVLSYFNHGDYSTFRRACSLVFPRQFESDPYFASNLFLASLLSGLIEVSETERSTWWWVAFDGDVHVRSVRAKQIWTSKASISERDVDSTTFIFDSSARPLVVGKKLKNFDFCNELYAGEFWNIFPKFRDCERELCQIVNFRFDLGLSLEIYNHLSGQWERSDVDRLEKPLLVRAKQEFSGFNYFVINPPLGLLFRISQPEWAFVVAAELLNWPSSVLFSCHKDTISMSRSVRLPSPILRYLFSSSAWVRVGKRIEFSEIESTAKDGLLNYLNNAGS